MRSWRGIGSKFLIRKGYNIQLSAILMLIAVWEFGVRLSNIPPWILPPPSRALIALIDSFNLIVYHTKVTLYESLVGFTAAIVFSFIIAFLMDSVKVLKKVFYPVLIASQTIPIITVAPLFLIWFGYGILPKVIVVALVCFFPVTVSFIEGLESVDREMYDLLKSMGASRMQIFKMVKLPGAMPSLFSGLKISAAYSIMGAIIGEWLGAKAGLGEFMNRAMHSFAVDKVFAAILVITVLSLGVFRIIHFMGMHLMPWTRFTTTNGQ